MKKYISILIVMVMTALSLNAYAYTVTEFNLSDTVKPSDWAEAEVNKALEISCLKFI